MKGSGTLKIFQAIACCTFFLACSQTKEKESIPFITLIKEQRAMLTDDEDSPTCVIRIAIDTIADTAHISHLVNDEIKKVIFNNHCAQTLNAAIDSFCTRHIASYKENVRHLYEADRKQDIKTTWYDYHYDIAVEHEYGANDCLCYRITDTRYEGGVNEMKYIHCLNFDLQNGRKLILENICQPTFRTVIPTLLLKKLQEKYHCKNLEELREEGFLLLSEIYVPENYLLEKEGITFIYNADEIAPYKKGNITLHIPYGELEPIIKLEYKYLWN